MIYNKTCLYSATAGTNSITLPEPLSAFERYVVKVSPGIYWESVCTGDRTVQRFNRYGDWNHQGYMVWPANWVISNGTKKLDCNRFQMLWQNSAVNKVGAFGWGNTASNIKHMYEVWGINRKDYTTAQGEGKPEGDWKTYNETLLWSGTDYANQSHITLSNRAVGYERLKIGVGSFGESTNIIETDSPQDYTAWLPLTSYWGTTTGSFYLSMHRYQWDNETSGLSAVSGKTWQLGTGAADPFSTTGNYTDTDTHIRRPVWAIWGVNEKDKYKLIPGSMTGGTISANRNSGYEHDITTIIGVPAGDEWKCSAINITGAELTGNDFMFGNSNVSAQAEFEHSRELTLENGDHGVLSADKMSGFSGDVVTVDATTDEGWYLSAIALTGAEATGFKFMFTGSDVTALGEYTDVGFPITYLSDEHVSLTGDTTIFIPGSEGITLDSGYDAYYRISGYDITNGSIIDGKLVPTGPCTIKAVETPNYFTATGNFEKGSNVTCDAGTKYGSTTIYSNVGQKYALHVGHTGDIPSSWYATSNRWSPSDASAYSITLNAKMQFTGRIAPDYNGAAAYMTGVTLVGSTQNQSQTFSVTTYAAATRSYSKTVTTTTQSTYGVSGRLGSKKYTAGGTTRRGIATYIANGTTGTWTATGIAP
jgi:hypothetical protein